MTDIGEWQEIVTELNRRPIDQERLRALLYKRRQCILMELGEIEEFLEEPRSRTPKRKREEVGQ